MFKKFIITINVFLFCLLFVGCQESKVSDEQIIQDIPEEHRSLNFYDSTRILEVDSIEIEKRNTDKNKDVIYFTAEMSDDFYHLTKQFTFYYNNYTEGGLILDSIDVRDILSISTDKENLPNEMLDTVSYHMGIVYGDENYEQTNIEEYISENNYPQYLISYDINSHSKYLRKTGSIQVLLTLDYDDGSYYWACDEYGTNNLDFGLTDNIIGNYKYKIPSGDILSLTIDEYDKESNAIHIANAQCISSFNTYEISDITINPSEISIDNEYIDYYLNEFHTTIRFYETRSTSRL